MSLEQMSLAEQSERNGFSRVDKFTGEKIINTYPVQTDLLNINNEAVVNLPHFVKLDNGQTVVRQLCELALVENHRAELN